MVESPNIQSEVQRFFTDSDTYEETLENGQEVLALLVESYKTEGKTLPSLSIPPFSKNGGAVATFQIHHYDDDTAYSKNKQKLILVTFDNE